MWPISLISEAPAQQLAISGRGRGYDMKKRTYLQILLAPLFLVVILCPKIKSKEIFQKNSFLAVWPSKNCEIDIQAQRIPENMIMSAKRSVSQFQTMTNGYEYVYITKTDTPVCLSSSFRVFSSHQDRNLVKKQLNMPEIIPNLQIQV